MPIKLQWTALDVIKCLIIWQMFSNAIPTRILRLTLKCDNQIRYSFLKKCKHQIWMGTSWIKKCIQCKDTFHLQFASDHIFN